jgi:hypothetical protein
MTIFRWIIGVLLALFTAGSVLSFVLFLAFDIDIWIQRARSLRRGAYLVALFWFNIEIWGRVVWAIFHW